MDDAQLQTVWQQRQFRDAIAPLGDPLATLMKRKLSKRVRQLAALGTIWDQTLPEEILEHTALESFSRGVLTVMVDSAAHRFQLRTLLDGGLLRHLQEHSPGALNKVRLVPGQFYSIDPSGNARYVL